MGLKKSSRFGTKDVQVQCDNFEIIEMENKMIRSIIFMWLCVFFAHLRAEAGEIFDGQLHKSPFALWQEGTNTLIAGQVSAYRYESNAWISALGPDVLTNAVNSNCVEVAVRKCFDERQQTNGVLAFVRFQWGRYVAMVLGVGRDSSSMDMTVVPFEMTDGSYVISTNLDMFNLYNTVITAHPFMSCCTNTEYEAAITNGMVVADGGGVNNDDPLRLFFRFDETAMKTLDNLLDPQWPYIERLVSLAVTDDLALFKDAYSINYYDGRDQAFLSSQVFFKSFMKSLQNPNALRLLAQIKGTDRAVAFCVPDKAYPLGLSKMVMWPFVKEGNTWFLGSKIFTNEPSSAFFVNNLLANPNLCTWVAQALPSTVEFANRNQTVTADSNDQVSVSLVLSRALFGVNSVHYQVTGGTATNGVDYRINPNGEVVLGAGVTEGRIYIEGVSSSSQGKSIELALSNPSSGLSVGAHDRVTIVIGSIAPSVVLLPEPIVSVFATPSELAVPVALSKPMPDAVSVMYRVVNGEASNGVDYICASTGTVTFIPGSVLTNVYIRILTNSLVKTRQTFLLNLEKVDSANIGLGDPSTVVVVIDRQAESRSVSFAAQSTTTSKENHNVSVNILLAGGQSTTGWVNYAVYDITARNGQDYILSPSGTVLFAAGQLSAELAINVTGTEGVVSNATFQLHLTGASEGVTIRSPSNHNFSINY